MLCESPPRRQNLHRRHARTCARGETSCAPSKLDRSCRSAHHSRRSLGKRHPESGASLTKFSRHYLRTQQYSITALTDSLGAVKERYAYDAYGNLSIFDGAGASRSATAEGNRYTYTGREWDEELGLYHYRARTYDSMAGRFLGRDPIGFNGLSNNLYQFVNSSPIHSIDPTGLCKRLRITASGAPTIKPYGGGLIVDITKIDWEDTETTTLPDGSKIDIPVISPQIVTGQVVMTIACRKTQTYAASYKCNCPCGTVITSLRKTDSVDYAVFVKRSHGVMLMKKRIYDISIFVPPGKIKLPPSIPSQSPLIITWWEIRKEDRPFAIQACKAAASNAPPTTPPSFPSSPKLCP